MSWCPHFRPTFLPFKALGLLGFREKEEVGLPEVQVAERAVEEGKVLTEREAIYAKWLAALRSGEYRQTSGMLRNERGYCCLGLVNEVGFGATWCFNEVFMAYMDERGIVNTLSQQKAKRLGLYQHITAEERLDAGYTSECDVLRFHLLAWLNDTAGWSFEEIAVFMERHGWHKEERE